MEAIKAGDYVDVTGCVQYLRQRRCLMVQTEVSDSMITKNFINILITHCRLSTYLYTMLWCFTSVSFMEILPITHMLKWMAQSHQLLMAMMKTLLNTLPLTRRGPILLKKKPLHNPQKMICRTSSIIHTHSRTLL